MGHAVVILAAGLGTRMKSKLPKVLHPLLGKPMVAYVVETALQSGAERVVVVLGHGADEVRRALQDYPVEYAVQEPLLGTAHALMQARPLLEDFPGPIVLRQGDTPLVRAETITELVRSLETSDLVLLTVRMADPTGMGRIIRDGDGEIIANVEEKDANLAQRAIKEVNAGVYAFGQDVWAALEGVDNRNAAGEFYLPDLIRVYRAMGKRVKGLESRDPSELLGVNTRSQLAQAEAILLARLRQHWMDRGVRMIQPETIYLEPSVELAPDVTLWPGVILRGATKIGEGCEIGAYSVLTDMELEPGVTLRPNVVAERSLIQSGADAGPFARFRAGVVLEEGVHVGNFVEMKNTRMRRGAKAGHVAYLGDAEIGEGSNIGAGTITANYDGKQKHRTIVGRGVFIGSNTTLIAPIKIADGAYVAGGSALNQDVPEDALAIARERQRNIEGYTRRKRGRAD
ncbi:MAG: UDP-N-acetylglucosamine diphosphorylase/glucosamine-1-phosphate N-acetyltransferase [Meiothermus sp.]